MFVKPHSKKTNNFHQNVFHVVEMRLKCDIAAHKNLALDFIAASDLHNLRQLRVKDC